MADLGQSLSKFYKNVLTTSLYNVGVGTYCFILDFMGLWQN